MVKRYIGWYSLEAQVKSHFVIKNMWRVYDGLATSVSARGGITIGLHQGLRLSPYLFAWVMNELTKLIQGEAPLVFVDDIVLADKTRGRVNANLEIWLHALESKVSIK